MHTQELDRDLDAAPIAEADRFMNDLMAEVERHAPTIASVIKERQPELAETLGTPENILKYARLVIVKKAAESILDPRSHAELEGKFEEYRREAIGVIEVALDKFEDEYGDVGREAIAEGGGKRAIAEREVQKFDRGLLPLRQQPTQPHPLREHRGHTAGSISDHRHRRTSGAKPIRRRGSRRSGSGSRAGPDDPDDLADNPGPSPLPIGAGG